MFFAYHQWLSVDFWTNYCPPGLHTFLESSPLADWVSFWFLFYIIFHIYPDDRWNFSAAVASFNGIHRDCAWKLTAFCWSVEKQLQLLLCKLQIQLQLIRMATNLENLEYSGISLNMENSGNSQGILCNLRKKL